MTDALQGMSVEVLVKSQVAGDALSSELTTTRPGSV
jgi:hypothetical protein